MCNLFTKTWYVFEPMVNAVLYSATINFAETELTIMT
jgi:hypothetical protein